MSATDSDATPGEGEIYVEELVEKPVERDRFAVAFDTPHLYFVLRRADRQAGEHTLSVGATVAEWYDCDPDEDVLVVVNIDKAQEKALTVDGREDLRAAVKEGRLLERAFPASYLAPCSPDFREMWRAGEWAGLNEVFGR
jgi:hypothetical protein